jgi:D-alanine-D-alanine ligase
LTLALHKPKAKEVLRARGVPTPDWLEIRELSELEGRDLTFPLIVKPAREDASVGIHSSSVVRDHDALHEAVRRVVEELHQPALVEQYIAGREIYVPLLGNPLRALPLSEIDFTRLPGHLPRIVTYAGKWDVSSEEFSCTPSGECAVAGEQAVRIIEAAQAAFAALECRDYGRVDLRVAEDGTPYVIDINPNCDLSPTAGFARAALRGGLGYAQLASELVQVARRRHGLEIASGRRPGSAFGDARSDLSVHAGGSGVRLGTG